ncbi:unnamed protein product [Cuscuta epithymum]|uniref:Growth-regulating factor n=2 Tax=Cuscuta epithymum TaxID=186058 RepID=A0AAV0EXA6_9ASTE|nr:unnamed protein product [Cuscuta epithymum]
MDFDLKQWRNQEESEAKAPRIMLDLHSTPTTHGGGGGSGVSSFSALPLFVSEPTTTKLSAYSPDSTYTATIKIPRAGKSYFSLGQWQELELQALIFRHMIAGAPVPQELLHIVKKSSPPFYFPHHLHPHLHHPQSMMQAGYWGRAAMDPEPGRCRRTDGKKWRCSRDVVGGQKYCERHVHRGRNRSRKSAETPMPVSTPTAGGGLAGKSAADAQPPSLSAAADPLPSGDPFHAKQREMEPIVRPNGPWEAPSDGRSSGQTLRRFFDDWPRPLQETERAAGADASSATNLSISFPGNATSDFSLKLSTGEGISNGRPELRNSWGTSQVVASMGGGPLAEALRSSTSASSPTSVLHQLQQNSTSTITS